MFHASVLLLSPLLAVGLGEQVNDSTSTMPTSSQSTSTMPTSSQSTSTMPTSSQSTSTMPTPSQSTSTMPTSSPKPWIPFYNSWNPFHNTWYPFASSWSPFSKSFYHFLLGPNWIVQQIHNAMQQIDSTIGGSLPNISTSSGNTTVTAIINGKVYKATFPEGTSVSVTTTSSTVNGTSTATVTLTADGKTYVYETAGNHTTVTSDGKELPDGGPFHVTSLPLPFLPAYPRPHHHRKKYYFDRK